MEQQLFNSQDYKAILNNLFDEWDEKEQGPKPPRHDFEMGALAWHKLEKKHQQIIDAVRSSADKFLAYTLNDPFYGMTNERAMVYSIADLLEVVLKLRGEDELEITYKDGDIYVYRQYKERGTSVIRLRCLRDMNKIAYAGSKVIERMRTHAYSYAYVGNEFLELATYSLAPYLEDFLGIEARKDLEERNGRSHI